MCNSNILVIGTLDTKGPEVEYIKELIEKRGHKATIIDTGVLAPPTFTPDISREEVAEAGGRSLQELLSAHHREQAMKTMGEGAAKILGELYGAARLDGVIAVGGGQGTSVATTAMKALPLGVPKFMVSTVASGNIRPFIGNKDIAMMFSVADIMGGINVVTRTILSNAVGAIVGMVEVGIKMQTSPGKTVIAITAMGTTTPAAMAAKNALEEKGYETVLFHASGACGAAMEELVYQGMFGAVLDLSTHELIGEVVHDDIYAPVSPGRLEAGSRLGIPMVVVPGGLDQLVFGEPDTIRTKYRGRKVAYHNPHITCVRTSAEELDIVSGIMAKRLNNAKGPVAVVIPLRGFSEYDKEGGLLFDPEADQAFIRSLKSRLTADVGVVEVNAHINEPGFAEKAVAILEEMRKKNRETETCFKG